jgi:hypothetical protein
VVFVQWASCEGVGVCAVWRLVIKIEVIWMAGNRWSICRRQASIYPSCNPLTTHFPVYKRNGRTTARMYPIPLRPLCDTLRAFRTCCTRHFSKGSCWPEGGDHTLWQLRSLRPRMSYHSSVAEVGADAHRLGRCPRSGFISEDGKSNGRRFTWVSAFKFPLVCPHPAGLRSVFSYPMDLRHRPDGTGLADCLTAPLRPLWKL